MKTKTADVRYCAVSKRRIQNYTPHFNVDNLKYLKDWIQERYEVHLKKDFYQYSPPWTQDPIIANYRFTNVRREHDRETRWLIDNIAKNGSLTYDEKLLNIILFRTWNRSRTFCLYGGPFKWDDLKKGPKNFRRKLSLEPDEKVFTSVFSVSFLKEIWRFSDGNGALKYKKIKRDLPSGVEALHDDVPLRMFFIPQWIIQNFALEGIKSSRTQSGVYQQICNIPGFGEFLAYQVFVDFTYIEEFPFSENEFVICGPGCKKGIDLVVEDKGGLNYEETLFWIRDNQYVALFPEEECQALFTDLPEEERYLNIMSLENCFCEISKYIRAKQGSGRLRHRYIAE